MNCWQYNDIRYELLMTHRVERITDSISYRQQEFNSSLESPH